MAAQLEPVGWRDGYPLAEQPRVLLRPQPDSTRRDWLAAMLASLIDHGDAFLWQPRTGVNSTGYPDVSIVLPYDDVQVEWSDESRLFRRYTYRDRTLPAGGIAPEIIHVSLDRRAGDLTGRSPLEAIEGSARADPRRGAVRGRLVRRGRVPPVTLKYDGQLSDADAERAQARWMERRARPLAGGPAEGLGS